MQGIQYDLRVIRACMVKEIKIALTERTFTILGIFFPLSLLIMLSLFALSGGLAPTVVVLQDKGPYAQTFYNSLINAHSFRIQQANGTEAHTMIQQGRIAAVVTIPSDFDLRVKGNEPVQVNVEINNLNTDFTNDIRRAIPLTITSFYAKAFPHIVTVVTQEHDLYRQDTGYIPYLTIPIFVITIVIASLLQAGTATAREWENATMKELFLSPAGRWAIVVGKMLGAYVMTIIPIGIVLMVLVFLMDVPPDHWNEVIGFTLLTMTTFIALGILLGTLLKQRLVLAGLAFGIALPLLFVSGAFGPVSFANQGAVIAAQIFPVYYSIILMQHAFHSFNLNTYGLNANLLILCGYTLGLIVLTSIVLQRNVTTK